MPVVNAADSLAIKKVFVFELNQDIFPAAWRLVKNAMSEADSMHADYVLIKENTYGGDLATADSIHTRLLHAKTNCNYMDHPKRCIGRCIALERGWG